MPFRSGIEGSIQEMRFDLLGRYARNVLLKEDPEQLTAASLMVNEGRWIPEPPSSHYGSAFCRCCDCLMRLWL